MENRWGVVNEQQEEVEGNAEEKQLLLDRKPSSMRHGGSYCHHFASL